MPSRHQWLGWCLSRFAGYKVGACRQAAEVVIALKVLIGAVPTCLILTGLCILMVSPTPQAPRQDDSQQQSLRRKSSLSLASNSRGLL